MAAPVWFYYSWGERGYYYNTCFSCLQNALLHMFRSFHEFSSQASMAAPVWFYYSWGERGYYYNTCFSCLQNALLHMFRSFHEFSSQNFLNFNNND